jgi:hypothetical protein
MTSAPYPPQNPTYPSRQRPILGPSSEVDPDEFVAAPEAGPSNFEDGSDVDVGGNLTKSGFHSKFILR